MLRAAFFLALLVALAAPARAQTTQCVTSAIAGGTADALTVPLLPCTPTSNLLLLTTTLANATTAPTLKVLGTPLPAAPILNNVGGPLVPGQLAANGRNLLTFNGNNWYLVVNGQPAFALGNQAGTLPWLNYLFEQTPGELSSYLHGVYNHNTSAYLGISADFTSANDPTNANQDSPRNGLAILATNSGSAATVDAILNIVQCTANNTYCVGINPIAAGGGTPGAKSLNNEVDIEFGVGDTNLGGSAGWFVNCFNVNGCGTAVQFGALNGYWSNGIGVGGLAPTNSAGIFALSGASMGSMVNTSTSGSYSLGAVVVGNNNGTNGQSIGFFGTGGHAGDQNLILTDSSNNFIIRQNTAGQVVLDIGITAAFSAKTVSPAARTTGIALLYNGGSGITFQDVTIGAADGCGAGFSCLRVPN